MLRAGRRWRVGLAVIVGITTFGVVVIGAQGAGANTVLVTNCNDSGPGSLRQAVAIASSGDTVSFALSPACSVITLTSGDIELSQNLTIDGPGASTLAVNGANVSQVFVVDIGVTAAIAGLTIEGGRNFNTSCECGGGIYNTNGTLSVTDSTVTGNHAYEGGGIYSNGTLTVVHSTVSDNGAQLEGGGILGNGTLTVDHSTVSANGSGYEGGGIFAYLTASITDSNLSGNSAGGLTGCNCGYGGGIYDLGGVLSVVDSTLSSNSATPVGNGGGIYTGANVGPSSTDITNSTLSGNSANGLGGDIFNNGEPVNVSATILANSSSGGDCSGTITDIGYNLDDDGSCGFSGTSLSDTPAGLDPNGSQGNGGLTQTIALISVSAAIAHVTSGSLCSAPDQRGVTRPTPCDIGAYDAPAWQIATTPQDVTSAVSCPSPVDCFAVGYSTTGAGRILATTDGGATWTNQAVPAGVIDLIGIACPSTIDCYATGRTTGTTGVVVKTTDGGTTWTSQAVPSMSYIPGITCPSTGECFAAGQSSPDSSGGVIGAIAATTDGTTWQSQTIPSGAGSMNAVTCPSTTDCYSVGEGSVGGYIFATVDGGATWNRQGVPLPVGVLSGVSCPSTSTCVAVGYNTYDFAGTGAAVSTTDGGATWATQTVPPVVYSLTSVSCPTLTDCRAVGYNDPGTGTIIGSTDGGATWATETVPPGGLDLTAVACASPVDCYAVGGRSPQGGEILKAGPNLAPQAVTFTSTPTSPAVGTMYSVSATGGGSGNPVTFSSGTPSVCVVSGALVGLVGAGTCTIHADQAGNATYNPAPTVFQSFSVAPGGQSISFTSAPPSNVVVAGPTYSALASGGPSGNAVVITVDGASSTVCAIAGGVVSFIAGGTCTLDANQAGDANHLAAPQVQQTFSVAKIPQTITFTSFPPTGASVAGPNYTVTAVGGSSGNPVTFTADPSATTVCSVSGSTVSFTGSGTCNIDANQSGTFSFAAAAQVQQSFTVGPVAITTTSLPDGSVRVSYSTMLAAADGIAPYRWSLLSGSLPAGLHMTSTGLITGKPKASGSSTFTVKVVDHKTATHAQQTATQALSITVTQPTPVITLVHPNTGPVTGGTRVTITGTSLESAMSVTFGGVAAESFTVNGTGTKITAYSPAEGAGTVDIVVTTPGGASVPGATDLFTYP